ncbi:DUF3372 domain-containing protein [Gleimia sp. 6138-11-ORH1]|uniref:alpha-1,6-glucosidase domain-containing protein n=1 Tax=Gleimia sp. 6138-11-ORH1 TaxID=2973937 RepID=UPI002169A744|nr:alpha-1,6-glucosidase domain-containing protein [Gleimia sp. 6138-11-ORH1]MCS4485043.1 DUF3372 domain-containing protein [Gleimia sp. 6138-11-ORH1]
MKKVKAVESTPPALAGLNLARAQWIDADTLAISKHQLANQPPDSVETYLLINEKALTTALEVAKLLEKTHISGENSTLIKLTPSVLSQTQRAKWPHLQNHAIYQIPADTKLNRTEALTQAIQVLTQQNGKILGLTGTQIPGIIDALYGIHAKNKPLGITWNEETPTLSIWAPTATEVKLQLGPTENTPEANAKNYAEYPLELEAETGIWKIIGNPNWKNCTYRYAIKVFVPQLNEEVTNLVTDPYSVGLNHNSTRSVILDLTAEHLKPAGWEQLKIPTLPRAVDQMIYELHVRDFSIHDQSVPASWRGTYRAFTLPNSAGMQHLTRLANAGVNSIHLLPTYDIASLPKPRETQTQPQIPAFTDPASPAPQAAVAAVADTDGYNWGYDPHHYQVPEGSYATDSSSAGKVKEFRSLVQALANTGQHGLRVVADQVYNHLYRSGQHEKALLDRIVPGYYHRFSEDGLVETSTCCANLATEHIMMEKLMVDSVVHWAKHYKISGFRFDLMGHHSTENMRAVKTALASLTEAKDGIAGEHIHLYGEGWNFGEVADNARFHQATQGQLNGTGIGTFNDRIRDAIIGDHFTGFDPTRGYASGLAQVEASKLPLLLAKADVIRLGMVGNLKTYQWETSQGLKTGETLKDFGQIVGYASEPAETINYVDAHDNQTLYDLSVIKLPQATPMEERVRYNLIQLAPVTLGQAPAFWHGGTDLLRSKSLDRDSYNSGDHFNAIDWTKQSHNFGVGLPAWERNEQVDHNWDKMRPLLRNPALVASASALEKAHGLALELLQLRSALPLLRLGSAKLICQKVKFPNQGVGYVSPVIAMHVDDTVGKQVDPRMQHLLVAINPLPHETVNTYPDLQGIDFKLHELQAKSPVDERVKETRWEKGVAKLTLPALTVAVLYAA